LTFKRAILTSLRRFEIGTEVASKAIGAKTETTVVRILVTAVLTRSRQRVTSASTCRVYNHRYQHRRRRQKNTLPLFLLPAPSLPLEVGPWNPATGSGEAL